MFDDHKYKEITTFEELRVLYETEKMSWNLYLSFVDLLDRGITIKRFYNK